jgi:hypothetical protein
MSFDVCSQSQECPVGTACVSRVCRPPTNGDLSSTVLVDGFSSDEIALTRSAPGSFGVEAPKSAVSMSCALFVGIPAFDRQSLSNLETSAARYRVFPLDDSRNSASTVNLRLDDLKPFTNPECSQSSALDTGASIVVPVESLHLGCWATSLDAVIAATSLLSLDPSELPEFGATPLASCDQSASPTDGSSCLQASQIGSCLSHICVADGAGDADDPGVVAPTNSVCDRGADGTPCEVSSPRQGRCFDGSCLDQGQVFSPLVNASCTGLEQWENCFPSPLGLIGTCYSELCRQRCHDVTDCNDGEVCTRPPAPSYLGVCTGSKERAP